MLHQLGLAYREQKKFEEAEPKKLPTVSEFLVKEVNKCEICDFAANYKSQLVTHMRIHTTVKPFKCSECEYSAAHKVTLVRHMATHTGIKPFRCSECEYSAAQKENLARHLKTHNL